MISPAQSRAARGWLDWSQDDLARHASVSVSTVRDFEKGRRAPITNNVAALVAALERAGVTMVYDTLGKPIGITARPIDAPKPVL